MKRVYFLALQDLDIADRNRRPDCETWSDARPCQVSLDWPLSNTRNTDYQATTGARLRPVKRQTLYPLKNN